MPEFIEYKARFSRRLSGACRLALRPIVVRTKGLTKGRRARPVYKREARRRRREGKLIENREQRRRNRRRLFSSKLTGSRQQRCSSRSPDPLGRRGKFLRPKGIIQRGNCETVEIMSCEYLRTINKLRPAETFGPEENYASAVKPCLAYFPRQVGFNLAWRYNWWEVSQILGIQWD